MLGIRKRLMFGVLTFIEVRSMIKGPKDTVRVKFTAKVSSLILDLGVKDFTVKYIFCPD